MEFAQHVTLFSGIISLFMIVFAFWWSSDGFYNCLVKTFFSIFSVYGILIFLESSNLLKTIVIF